MNDKKTPTCEEYLKVIEDVFANIPKVLNDIGDAIMRGLERADSRDKPCPHRVINAYDGKGECSDCHATFRRTTNGWETIDKPHEHNFVKAPNGDYICQCGAHQTYTEPVEPQDLSESELQELSNFGNIGGRLSVKSFTQFLNRLIAEVWRRRSEEKEFDNTLHRSERIFWNSALNAVLSFENHINPPRTLQALYDTVRELKKPDSELTPEAQKAFDHAESCSQSQESDMRPPGRYPPTNPYCPQHGEKWANYRKHKGAHYNGTIPMSDKCKCNPEYGKNEPVPGEESKIVYTQDYLSKIEKGTMATFGGKTYVATKVTPGKSITQVTWEEAKPESKLCPGGQPEGSVLCGLCNCLGMQSLTRT